MTIEQQIDRSYLENARACGKECVRYVLNKYISDLSESHTPVHETPLNRTIRKINVSSAYYSGLFLGLFLGAKPEEFKNGRGQEIN